MARKKVSVSVIIPVYNAEEYLDRCLKSVSSQTLRSIEIFCVDDGSTDSSQDIIRKFAERDKRITIIQQKNAGAAVARNKGLERATGEYIGFVDSDDYIDADYFESLYKTAKKQKAGIAKAYVKVDDDSANSTIHRFGLRSYSDYEDQYNKYMKEAIARSKLNQRFVVWLAIFERKMLLQNNIYFPPEIRTGQDVLFNIKAGYFANKIIYAEKPTYYHRVMHEGSLMTQLAHTDQGLLSRTLLIKESVAFLNSKPDYDRDIYISHVLDAINFIHDRKSNVRDEDIADKISQSLSDTWKKIKYKKDIQVIIQERDVRFSKVIGDSRKLLEYIQEVSFMKFNGLAVSIIIPVYNQEKYLEQCLDSVLNQTLRNIEIICVDDGSTDRTSTILRHYAENDSRVKVITKKHSNAGEARNAGLKVAIGKYLSFLDSDDYFELNMLEVMVKNAEENELDIVVCRSKSYNQRTKKVVPLDHAVKEFVSGRVYTQEDIRTSDLFINFIGWTWDKLFRTEYIREQELQFQEMDSVNDAYFTFSALAFAQKVSVVDEYFPYHRIENDTSTTEHAFKQEKWNNFFRAVFAIEAELREKDTISVFEKSLYTWLVGTSVWYIREIPETSREKYIKEVKKHVVGRFDLKKSNLPLEYWAIEKLEVISRSYADLLATYFIAEERSIGEDRVLAERIDKLESELKQQNETALLLEERLRTIHGSISWKLSRSLSVIVHPSRWGEILRRLSK